MSTDRVVRAIGQLVRVSMSEEAAQSSMGTYYEEKELTEAMEEWVAECASRLGMTPEQLNQAIDEANAKRS